MKTLVLFYSYSGHTKRLAQAFAAKEAVDIKDSAEQYSQKTRAEAVDFANRLHDDTEIYVKEVFEYLESTLDKVTDALQQSKDTLGKKFRGGE